MQVNMCEQLCEIKHGITWKGTLGALGTYRWRAPLASCPLGMRPGPWVGSCESDRRGAAPAQGSSP